MGWTGIYCDVRNVTYKELVKTYAPYLLDGWKTDDVQVELLKYSFVGSVLYAAMRTTYGNTREKSEYPDNPFIWAMVVKMEKVDKEFRYKEMGETCGPCYVDCPPSILNLLSSTTNEYAIKWRNECLKSHDRKRKNSALGKLELGASIKLTSGRYKDSVFTRVLYRGKPTWICRDLMMRAFPKYINHFGYEVVDGNYK